MHETIMQSLLQIVAKIRNFYFYLQSDVFNRYDVQEYFKRFP